MMLKTGRGTTKVCDQGEVEEDSFTSQVINFGKAEHRNKTQGVILHWQGLSKISGRTRVSRCPVQALLEKHKETSNAEEHVDRVFS